MTENVNILGDLQRLTLEPGDKFILSSRHPLPAQAHAMLREAWAEFHSDRSEVPKLLIVDDRLKLQVVNIPFDQDVIDLAMAIRDSSDEEVMKMITADEVKKLAGALLK